jgi:hypothetical protein
LPSLAQYRRNLAVESGPYIGPESYNVRATSGSNETKLVCSNYPITSGLSQSDLLRERPLYRPDAPLEQDRNRYVMTYDPPTGTITPDLIWAISPLFSSVSPNTYSYLETYTYGYFEDLLLSYENLEGTGIGGVGERFEVLGPWDAPTMHQLINDGLKQCWLVVDVVCTALEGVTRHDLRDVCPWLQDPNHVRQAGVLPVGIDPWTQDPFNAVVYGEVERDGGTFIFNTNYRTFNAGDQIWLRCYKRAYDHCRAAGGSYGEQSGLFAETDEAPIEREWLVSSALTVGWRRFGHLLEVQANQRLIRDQATAAAWFNERTHQHFTAVAPTLTFRKARHFGPVFR